MIVSREAHINITNRNKKIYADKGYEVKIGEISSICVGDLTNSCPSKICLKCDYCKSNYEIKFSDYSKTRNIYINKDACINCTADKREDILEYKLRNGLINKDNKRGKWKSKDTVLSLLNEYISEFGFIGSNEKDVNKLWRKINRGLKILNLTVEEAVFQLGYQIENLRLKKPNGYYDDFNVIKEKIQSFITEHNKFPSQIEMTKELNIYNYIRHGTLNDIKIMMQYNDETDIIDNSGFINKSNYEKIVANYLISQGIPFKREDMPFKRFGVKKKFKSDFLLLTESGEEIHCEVWGGERTGNSPSKFPDYRKNMTEKKNLYRKHGIILISIVPDIFNCSIKNMQKKTS